MITLEEFLQLIRDRLGLPVTVEDAARGLDQLPGWDSMHLLWLITSVEQLTGRRVPMPEVLEASSLEQIYLAATKQ